MAYHPYLLPEYSIVTVQHQAGPTMSSSQMFAWLAGLLSRGIPIPLVHSGVLGPFMLPIQAGSKAWLPLSCCAGRSPPVFVTESCSSPSGLLWELGITRGSWQEADRSGFYLRKHQLGAELTAWVNVGACIRQVNEIKSRGGTAAVDQPNGRHWLECPIP